MQNRLSRISTILPLNTKDDKVGPSRIIKFLLLHWRGFFLVIFPLIFLPIIFYGPEVKAYSCLYILLLMAFYWLTEALPLPVTGMIPIFAFPVAGIMSTEEVCASYFSDNLVWFLGVIIVALAVEYCNLHKRIALKAIQIVGCKPRRLHLGLILITAFISLWISNAAVIAMMCPIIKAVLKNIEGTVQGVSIVEGGEHTSYSPSKLAICFYLSAAYASTIGGAGTLIATTTNLAMKGIYDGRFPDAAESIDFTHFIMYAIPPLFIITLLMCLYLQCLYMGLFRPKSDDAEEINYSKDIIRAAEKRIDRKYFQMGSMSCHEISVLIIFILMIFLYFTFHAWNQFFEKKVKYSSPTILIVILLFVLPINYAFCKYFTGKTNVLDEEPTNSIHSWKVLQQKIPWGLIFFIGGGFALAKGVEQSQLAILFRKFFFNYGMHPVLVMLLIIIFAECVTQLCLDVAVVNVLIPIVIEWCIAMELHPLYLVLPTGIACSMAFILPASNAPNAIVAMFANIKTRDMVAAGIGTTVISLIVLFIFCPTWGSLVYPNINNGLPDWLYK